MGWDITRRGLRSTTELVLTPRVENDIRYYTFQSVRLRSSEG
jgi:hypothetical protein